MNVSLRRENSVALVTVDNPPVNALSHAVRSGLVESLESALADPDVAAIVVICAGRTFIAGADIKEFGKPPLSPSLRDVIAAFEASPKPIIAAMHGTALGGGFELALACHYRCALPTAAVGLPEVKLGLLPGAGGTQRLPRLIGVEPALDMIVNGEPVPATRAMELGAIDEIVEGDLSAGALELARRISGAPVADRIISSRQIDPATAPPELFERYRQAVAKRTRGFFAPERCIQAVEAAVNLPFDEGLKRERALFEACMDSPASRAQRYLFFGERKVGKVPGLGRDVGLRTVDRAGVVGAGTMGTGIAICFANAGIPVTVIEAAEAALDKGMHRIRAQYESSRAKGRLDEESMRQRLELIDGSLDYESLADADLVVEAVFENLELKKQIFGKLATTLEPGAILATNTSTLDVDEIAAATERPEDVVGMHFFSPAHVMRLVEVVRGRASAESVVKTAMAVARRLGKVAVLAGVCRGFIGNRMLDGYLREANLLLLEGASPEEIDRALVEFGLPMGPLAMIDLAGIDINHNIREERQDLPEDERYFLIENRLFEQGRFGQKTGAGFYRYEPGSRRPLPDPSVEALIRKETERLGLEPRRFEPEDIVARCLYPVINEGARVLEEGIALRAVDIDVVWVTGYGFPRYRGGPMFYADTIGLQTVLDGIRNFGGDSDPFGYWTPAPLLARLVSEGRTFGSLDTD